MSTIFRPSRRGRRLGAARAAEYEVLAGRAFGDLLRDGSIALEPMSRILAHPG